MVSARAAGVGLILAVISGVAACGGDPPPAAEEATAPAYATATEAYEAVVQAYAGHECDVAAQLVDGSAQGIEQFLDGCEKRENLQVIKTLEVTGRPRDTSLDPLPPGVSEAVGLTAAFTAESGEPTDYYPDMVRMDGRWKLWLPGDDAGAPSGGPTPDRS
ncbi:hypothetical protein [Nocardioides marmoraquaticus]